MYTRSTQIQSFFALPFKTIIKKSKSYLKCRFFHKKDHKSYGELNDHSMSFFRCHKCQQYFVKRKFIRKVLDFCLILDILIGQQRNKIL